MSGNVPDVKYEKAVIPLEGIKLAILFGNPVTNSLHLIATPLQVQEACHCLNLTDDQLRRVMRELQDGMQKGLRKGTREL